MSQHFITKCSCGVTIVQCKCPAEFKTITLIERGCGRCHGSEADVELVDKRPDLWQIIDRRQKSVLLTLEDWKMISSKIHNHYHGEDE